MFRAAGVPFPRTGWTLNQFRSDAIKLTRNGNYGASLSGDWVREVDPFVRELGGHLDNSNGTKTVGYMDSPATVKAIQWWVNLFLKYKVSPTPAAAKALGIGDLFASGKAAMNVTGIWPSLGATGYPHTLKFNWGVAPFPLAGKTSKHINTICWAGFAMSHTSKKQALGWGLIKYMAGPVGDQVWGTAGGLPALKSVAAKDKVSKNPVSGVFLKEAKFTELPSDINGPAAPQAVSDTLSEGLDLLLNTPNAGTVKQVLTIEAQKGQKAINAYYGH
jgi:multiple sugar transport system substrate-binding protein